MQFHEDEELLLTTPTILTPPQSLAWEDLECSFLKMQRVQRIGLMAEEGQLWGLRRHQLGELMSVLKAGKFCLGRRTSLTSSRISKDRLRYRVFVVLFELL